MCLSKTIKLSTRQEQDPKCCVAKGPIHLNKIIINNLYKNLFNFFTFGEKQRFISKILYPFHYLLDANRA